MKVLYIIDGLMKGGKEHQLAKMLKGMQKYQDIHCELAVMSTS